MNLHPCALALALTLALTAAPARALALAGALAFALALSLAVGCAPAPCANDGECAAPAVCLIDVDGPRCATPLQPRGPVVLVEARTELAPVARSGRVSMRPLAVVVTRNKHPRTP